MIITILARDCHPAVAFTTTTTTTLRGAGGLYAAAAAVDDEQQEKHYGRKEAKLDHHSHQRQ